MPAGFYRPTSEIEPIVGIQFGIFSPEEIERRSVVEITTKDTYEGNEPKIGGLFDPRMGVLDNGKTCRSCGQSNHGCPGHFGHYRLARPVYFFQFLPLIRNVLSCVCIRCSKLLLDKEAHPGIQKKRGEARWRDVLTLSGNIKRCGQETEDGCGARQPTRYSPEGIARIVAEWDNLDTPSKEKGPKTLQPLEVEYVLHLFRRITDEDVDYMGLSRFWCRPDWMICTVLPIPPPQVRPSVVQENNQRSEDDLTHKLFDIIKNNKILQQKIEANANKAVIDEMTNVVQYHIATLVDNQIPGVAPSAQRSGRALKSIQQRLGSKEGRIRYNIQGKRVEFSARSVITPDPNISIAEIGVPMKIAMNLTKPDIVTPYNRDQLYRYVQNGADVFPGAKTIVRKDGRMISLKHVNTKEIVLHFGDTVNRHLMDGDTILFNRQPTLHRMSMMGHKVKVLPYNTFRLNVMVTSPYNADFDGDEMNAHIPQSYEASTELEEIAAVPHQIITPRDGKPVIGVVQDTLVGAYRITRPDVTINRREMMTLMMWNKRFGAPDFEGGKIMPKPGKPGAGRKARWTGQQVVSSLLPPINLDMKNKQQKMVSIRDGVLLEGQLDKEIFSKASKGIIHVTYNDYGPEKTVNLLDSLQSTIEQFLIYNGFSVGISDLVADAATREAMDEKIQARKKEIEEFLLQVHLDLFDNNTGKSNQEEFEGKVFGALNQATKEAGTLGQASLADENRLIAMVRCGSKGNEINVAQMIACVGQQNIDGKRIPYGFTDRTLPHYKKYDDGAEARGFIESSFIRGLSPQEFFFHAMSGREGLIDTAVKSVTGDTKIVITENGVPKCVAIGDWIDSHLASRAAEVEHFTERNMELLQLKIPASIPTVDAEGNVKWGDLVAVTRHDPGQRLYRIETLAGKSVTVTESQSLLIWNGNTFEKKSLPDVKEGDFVPVTARLEAPVATMTSVSLSAYLPKNEFLYGTDFVLATSAMNKSMEGRAQIPRGWWEENNGKTFTLPYDSKARLQRCLVRSKVDNITSGYVYPFTTNREHTRIPELFELNKENGLFLGLFLAEGNVDIKSGYIQITNNDDTIREFVKEWFDDRSICSSEDVKLNHIGGVSSCVRGYSTVLAQFLTCFVGHGAANKRVPAEAFVAPEEFIVGLLNGYFSGDGTISENSVDASSCSSELIDGISMLCTRLGIFGKVSHTQATSNNLGTEHIKPTHRIAIRAQWATQFAQRIELIDEAKNEKLSALKASEIHRNFEVKNDVVLDEITDIQVLDASAHPKVYDLTVPSTFNFGLANGLHVRDTADTGYIQRQLVKAMEDLVIQNDGTVRDAKMNLIQFHYGEDGVNSTKIENQSLDLQKMTEEDIRKNFGLEGETFQGVFSEGVIREDDEAQLQTFVEQILADRRLLVEGVFKKGQSIPIFSPVNIERVVFNSKLQGAFDATSQTDLTPLYVLQGIEKVIQRTQPYHHIWCALLRFHLAPHKIVKARFTKAVFDAVCERLILKNWQSQCQPGEQVGIIAAQSIGEPSTQMSCVYETIVLINCPNGENYFGPIGKFMDEILEQRTADITQYGENSSILDVSGYKVVSVSKDEKTSWSEISQFSRHMANGGLVKVTTKSGRTTTATLSHSFLKRSPKGIVPVLGSDLKLGMRIPIARRVPKVPTGPTHAREGTTTFTLNREFGWLCGLYLADGSLNGNDIKICKVHPIVETLLTNISNVYGWAFSTHNYQGEYGPSKDNIIQSKDLKNFLKNHFSTGSYAKNLSGAIYSYPTEFIAGLIGGYFDGDGNVNVERQQIRVGSRSEKLIRDINRLFGFVGFFTILGSETAVRIPGKVMWTLNVLKNDARRYKEEIGFKLAEKAAGLDQIIAYVERDDKHDTKEMYDKIPELGELIAETGRLLKMPGQSRNYGRWLKKESVGRLTLQNYVSDFKEMFALTKNTMPIDVYDTIFANLQALDSALNAGVLWDEITDIEYLEDPKTFVYDFTVPGNESFMVDDGIMVHNTLNSVDWDTRVLIAKDGQILSPQIGEFIDNYYTDLKERATKGDEAAAARIQTLPNNQIYIELKDGHDWKAVSCGKDGVVKWTTLEAITRHPVLNEDGTNTILEVETESGRTVKATKALSFLTRSEDNKVIEIKGSDLKVGTVVPIASHLALDQMPSHIDNLNYTINLMQKNLPLCNDVTEDVIWDPIKSIKEVMPMKEWVYDLTVAETRNFTTHDGIVLRDTFHLAGVAAKSNVTRGVPRLKELLKVTQNPKATSLTVFLKPEYRGSKDRAREVAQDLELTLLKDIVVKAAIYYDPKDEETVLAEDRDFIKFFKMFEGGTESAEPEEPWSKWMLRLELDRERMFNKNISMDDINLVLREKFSDEISTIYSDFNSPRLIMRIRLSVDPTNGVDLASLDDLTSIKKMQNRVLTSVVIRGVPSIKAVTYRKSKDHMELLNGVYTPVEEYVLDTDGSNIVEVINHPMVDATRIYTTHVYDVLDLLGIEAARTILLTEITGLFEEVGLNFRHLGILCDVMTRAGRLMSVDRYGINKNDIGPLAKASFEETEKILLKAALFGEVDPITGVSANIMTGQPIRGGTAFSQIMLDEAALMRLQQGLPPTETEEEEDDEDLTQDEIDRALYTDPDDLCNSTRLRVNMTLPAAGTYLDEADVEINEVAT
jgi:DNA-directed RNA polymerase beta' subunit